MRRLLPLTLCLVVLGACGSQEPRSAVTDPGETKRALAGSPAALAKLHAQSGDLLGGGEDAFRAHLRELRGYPVVVNKWASWCPPCRAEFPYFQRQATRRGKRIAFLGVNSNDNDGDAARFLREFPVPFPSYKDPRLAVAAAMKAVGAFPSTAFYDSKGHLAHVKQGGYATERKLIEDIERYAR
jgi:cytochrome c biogenesis protein CcmG, thiol:disulfide interchange protein DsbE